MAVQEREIHLFKIDFRGIVNLAGKIKGVAKTVLVDDSNRNWIIIEASELTPEKLKDFVSGKRSS